MEYLVRRLVAIGAALELAKHGGGAGLHVNHLARLVRRRHQDDLSAFPDQRLEREIARNREGLLQRVEQGVYKCTLGVDDLASRLARVEQARREEALGAAQTISEEGDDWWDHDDAQVPADTEEEESNVEETRFDPRTILGVAEDPESLGVYLAVPHAAERHPRG